MTPQKDWDMRRHVQFLKRVLRRLPAERRQRRDITLPEIAEAFSWSVAGLEAAVECGVLSGETCPDGVLRVSLKDLEDFYGGPTVDLVRQEPSASEEQAG